LELEIKRLEAFLGTGVNKASESLKNLVQPVNPKIMMASALRLGIRSVSNSLR
jgi:hypothetical protein